MEMNNKKAKNVISLIISGLLIIILFTGIEYFIYYYKVLNLLINILLYMVGGVAWWMIIGASNILYEENKNKPVVCLKIISIVGIFYCVLRIVFIMYAYLNGIETIGHIFVNLYSTARAISSYVWLNRFLNICRFGFVELKALVIIFSVLALNKSIREEYKPNKKFKYLGIINAFLAVMLGMLFIYCIDTAFFGVYLILYVVWLLIYISNMKTYINVSEDSNNGSIFNRIPEDEYQEFLSKMK